MFVFFALALTAMTANAQIAIKATGTTTINSALTSYTLSSSFDASGADKLVVTVSGERNSGSSGSTSISGVTYNGTPMTQSVQSTLGYSSGPAAIFYLDNPGAAGAIVATASRTLNGVHASWLALSGAAAGAAGATKASAGTSTSIANATLNALVVAHNHVNNGTVPVAQPPQTALLSSNGTNSDAAAGYQFVGTAGATVTSAFTTATITPVTVAAMFNVDPLGRVRK